MAHATGCLTLVPSAAIICAMPDSSRGLPLPVRPVLIGVLSALALTTVALVAGPTLGWAPIDFCRFYTGSKMILAGQNPYGQIPFFAPPWLAFLLSLLLVLPCSSAALAWTLLNVAIIIASSHVLWGPASVPGERRRMALLGLTAVTPYALFAYATGQLSAVALGACALAAWGLTTGRHWPIVAGLILASLKPHVVALPMLLVGLELMRRRQWMPFLLASAALATLCLIAALFVPAWPRTLLASWASGAFYESRENLLGLAAFDVPLWLTYPFVAYTLLLWWRRALDLHVLALAVAANPLAIPYSRSYDYVLLLLPLGAIWTASSSPKRRLALGLAVSAQLLPLIRAFTPQAGLVEALAPALCVLGLLLVLSRHLPHKFYGQQQE
jgi:hypothetical protein